MGRAAESRQIQARRDRSRTPATPAARALEGLLRPLEFAAAEDTAAAKDPLRGLEASVRNACAKVAGLRVPRDLQRTLARIERAFAEPLEGEPRRKAARRALEWLAPCLEPGWEERALDRRVDVLPGVGPKRAESLARRGLARIEDLLFHLPTRYDDRRSLVSVGELEVGLRATFIAEVLVADSTTGRGRGGRYRRILQAVVGDESGTVNLKWFRGGDALESQLVKGARVLVTGDVRRYRFSKELIHPDLEILSRPAKETGSPADAAESPEAPKPAGDPAAASKASAASGRGPAERLDFGELRRIVPQYPTPEGLPPRTLRGLIERALAEYGDLVAGHLPAELVRERKLPDAASALARVHDPDPDADPDDYRERRSPAHERLVLEELYLLELGLALRAQARARRPGIAIDVESDGVRRAPGRLPFALTGGQQRAWSEIRADLGRGQPMNRLLQGDVGCGKTAVAFLAAVAVAASGRQTALMAPTELLAEQHARTLGALASSAGDVVGGRPLSLRLLTASLARAETAEARRQLAAGEVDLVVGTHALVQEDVEFACLALGIVDEQHRFGVRQRRALAEKSRDGRVPHTLVMTATPIPRTLSLTLYGDLDLSVIDELPPGRQPVRTHLLRAGEGRRVVELVKETLARGEQVYVVYPLVEESEKVDLRDASESARRIQAAFPDHRVDLVHGRLDAGERADAMARFERGETAILVSTTVIEVGVDVPNATLMVVEHAERFGLAQLHQLRGRVGRGGRPGACVLVARSVSEDAEARLAALLETTDGFRIADADLRIRGPGEFLGTRQHGHLPDLRVADLVRDARWLAAAREAALASVRRDPGLCGAPALREAVEARWGERLDLAGVA
ncbi:MAG: ATP-dependent DNA helicase RecG [Myxococcota bacterium]